MASCDLNRLESLNQQYERQLKSCLQMKQHWEKMNYDYEALAERLCTISDKMTHEVMVPFGSLAFMPGKLVHTNEVTVLLGDNWFVERSAKQALDIVKRRMITCTNMLKDIEKEENQILEWLKHSKDMQEEDLIDIQEEYDAEKEEIWRNEHKKNIKKYKQAKSEKLVENDIHVTSDLMTILDQLQIEEDSEIKVIETKNSNCDIQVPEVKKSTINFNHSQIEVGKLTSQISNPENVSSPKILSPEDIYKHFGPTIPSVSKSILKKCNNKNESTESLNRIHKNRVHFEDEELKKPEKEYTLAVPIKSFAFSGTIVEKSPSDINLPNNSNSSNKLISKFKANRKATAIKSGETNTSGSVVNDNNNSKELINNQESTSSGDNLKSSITEIQRPKTAFSAILERSVMEPLKPNDFKAPIRPNSNLKAKRQPN